MTDNKSSNRGNSDQAADVALDITQLFLQMASRFGVGGSLPGLQGIAELASVIVDLVQVSYMFKNVVS